MAAVLLRPFRGGGFAAADLLRPSAQDRRLSEKSSMAWPASDHLQGLFPV
jgi:hypothetical protein